jgi:hypothetical protein
MRPAWFVLSFAAVLAACGTEPDTSAMPTFVNWMEWPAEVAVGAPVAVRLIVDRPCAQIVALRAPALVDNSAVTFEPFFLVKNGLVFCPAAAAARPSVIGYFGFDTTEVVDGLPADFDRVYDMRAAASVYTVVPLVAALPVRTFGTITVRVGQPDASRTRAAGFAYEYTDGAGCVRLQPLGVYTSGGYVVENVDSASVLGGMVHGYLYQPAAPLCGETRVFHLESGN